jgi:hypothetical protein
VLPNIRQFIATALQQITKQSKIKKAESQLDKAIESLRQAEGDIFFDKDNLQALENGSGSLIKFGIEPGDASSKTIQQVFGAFSDLHRAHGGAGFTVHETDTQSEYPLYMLPIGYEMTGEGSAN